MFCVIPRFYRYDSVDFVTDFIDNSAVAFFLFSFSFSFHCGVDSVRDSKAVCVLVGNTAEHYVLMQGANTLIQQSALTFCWIVPTI